MGVVGYVVGYHEPEPPQGMKEKFDAHGGAVLDLDRDGLLDLYVSQGAVGGTDTSFHSENGLFWGTPDGRGSSAAVGQPGRLGSSVRGAAGTTWLWLMWMVTASSTSSHVTGTATTTT